MLLMPTIELQPVIWGMALAALAISTFLNVAIWSVFGPGGYLKRLFWAHLVGSIVAIGFSVGAAILYMTNDMNVGDVGPFFIGLVSIPPISLAAQLPLWIFRGFFGWQFVYGENAPTQPYTLRDIFTLTFVFALGFAAPQFTTSLSGRMVPGVYNETAEVAVTQPDGSIVYEAQDAQEQAMAERRQLEQAMREGVFFGYLCASAYAIVISVFSLPVFLFMFRLSDIRLGCLASALYSLSLCITPLIIFAIFAARHRWTWRTWLCLIDGNHAGGLDIHTSCRISRRRLQTYLSATIQQSSRRGNHRRSTFGEFRPTD